MGFGLDRDRWRGIDRALPGSIRRSGKPPRERCWRRSVPAHARRRFSPAQQDRQPRSLDDDGSQPSALTELTPATAVTLEQLVGAQGTFAAGLVEFQAPGARFLPRVEEWLHRLPAGLDAVGALKQAVVAAHAVVDQRLIPGSRLRLQ